MMMQCCFDKTEDGDHLLDHLSKIRLRRKRRHCDGSLAAANESGGWCTICITLTLHVNETFDCNKWAGMLPPVQGGRRLKEFLLWFVFGSCFCRVWRLLVPADHSDGRRCSGKTFPPVWCACDDVMMLVPQWASAVSSKVVQIWMTDVGGIDFWKWGWRTTVEECCLCCCT